MDSVRRAAPSSPPLPVIEFTFSPVVTTGGMGFTGAADLTSSSNPFDVFAPAQTSGNFVSLPARSHASIPASFVMGKGVRGWMVVSLDDRNGARQADLVRVGH